jgi:hypothetical protein
MGKTFKREKSFGPKKIPNKNVRKVDSNRDIKDPDVILDLADEEEDENLEEEIFVYEKRRLHP